jgi:hypothetical protein
VANDKRFESDDPMEIVGMRFPDDDGKIADEMGRTFIDEFLRMGWPPDEILSLFRDPFYRAAHAVYRRRGEPFVVEMIASVHAARQEI